MTLALIPCKPIHATRGALISSSRVPTHSYETPPWHIFYAANKPAYTTIFPPALDLISSYSTMYAPAFLHPTVALVGMRAYKLTV